MKKIVALLLCFLFCLSSFTFAEESWVCPNCGKDCTDNFCSSCGTPKPQDWTCPNCGKECSENFCPKCGTKKPSKGADVKPGDIVTFGSYPQGANGEVMPIERTVLDVQDGKALLLSKYGLDAKPYNEDRVDITWEKCTLRTWLNGEFLKTAFDSTEQARIQLTAVDNSRAQGYNRYKTNGGNDTQDKVFLLSYAEANRYLGVRYWKESGAGDNIDSRVSPTAYAKANGAYTSSSDKTAEGAYAGWWWLRSPGGLQDYASFVYDGGSLYYYGVYFDLGGVRPALWVEIS